MSAMARAIRRREANWTEASYRAATMRLDMSPAAEQAITVSATTHAGASMAQDMARL
jgi:hypothetical protein